MIGPVEVLQLMADHKPLPQESCRNVSEGEIGQLQEESKRILDSLFLALTSGLLDDDEQDDIHGNLLALLDKHGWYEAASILALHWAYLAIGFDLDILPAADDKDAETLVKAFVLAAKHSENEEGAWTIPLAMFASTNRQTANEFVVRMLYTAATATVTRAGEGT
jgi:hypothetical protein